MTEQKHAMLEMIKIQGWASSWTNPLSPRPPWGEFPTGEATLGEL